MILARIILVLMYTTLDESYGQKENPQYLRGLTYRQLIGTSDQCRICSADGEITPVFCNIVAAPMADYRTYIARIFEEYVEEDPCYCGKIGSNSVNEACTRIPDVCKTLSKDAVCQEAGLTCDGSQWSTFHCICTEGWQGQLCTVPSSAGNVVKTPILVHYVHAPLFQHQLSSETQVVPGLHFVTESLGEDFRLIVGFEDGRTIQVGPSSFVRKNHRDECLTDIRQKIHYISEYHCNLIPAGDIYGYGIFLDKMLRINLLTPDNLIPTNSTYPFKSAGRFANLNIQARNKDQVTWEWDSLRVFVPYQKHFIVGSRYLRIHGCGEDKDSVPMKSVDETITLKASTDVWPWISTDSFETFTVRDHRWYIEDISDPGKLDDMIPTSQLPEKYSQGTDGRTIIIPEGELSGGKYLVIYDFMQELLNHSAIDNLFVARKLCYFDIVNDLSMKVYLHTRNRSIPCNLPFNVDVENYNSRYYDNARLSITWTCEGSTTAECGIQQTKGIQPFTNILKCGMEYKFTATVTHPRSTETLRYQIEIKSEDQEVIVEIQCIESCGYKVNPDRFLYLRATEKPSISTLWTWNIREVKRTPESGQETVEEDQVGGLRQLNTEANICIVPPNKLTFGKEYRIYARTPNAYSSYTVMVNEPPEGGTCTVDPSSGVSLETEFRIDCRGWKDDDVPLTYRVLEVPDRNRPEVEPLACAESPVIGELKFRRNDITVMIFDSLKLRSMYNLTVSLTEPTELIEEKRVGKNIKDINIKLEGSALLPALKAIDELTKMIEDQHLLISEDTSLKLLHSLSQINTFDEACDLEKAIDVLNRILKLKTPEPKHHTDLLMLEASKQLKWHAGVAHTLSNENKLNSPFDKELLASSITKAACQILLARDRVLEDDTVPVEIHEEHQYRVNEARDHTLHSMALLGTLLTKYLKYQMEKYVLRRDCFNILTKFGNASQIRDELNKIDLPDEYYKNSSASTAVIDFKEDVLWGIPNEIGLLGVIAEIFRKTPDTKGPVDFSLKVPNYHVRNMSVAGVCHLTPVCSTNDKLDKSFTIHRFTLPDGEGVVVLNFAPSLVGKVKVFAKQSYKPDYKDVFSRPTLNSTEALVNFSNRNHGTDSTFYIASVAANGSSRRIDYSFTYRVLRCSIYIGGQFVSRGCTFLNLTFVNPLKDPTVHCRCNLSTDASSFTTWFSVDIITPPHSLVLANDIYLFSMVLENYYTALLVAIVIAALLVILLWGYRLDCDDERCRNVIVMEDNYPGDSHAYVIAVITGQGIGSGTSSRVAIRVFGEQGHSRVHILEHSERKTLLSGRDDWFLMTTAKRLGRITKIQIWHNHVGISPEWYCKKVSIFDLSNHIKYNFIVERWFTFDLRVSLEEARMYEGLAATDAEVSKKWYLLVGGWIFSEMREKHHVASIFRRHPRSFYTRCQRVIISVTFITTTMLVSLMFFKVDEVGPADWPLIPFKLIDVWTGIKSSIISSLITSAVVICFGFHKKYETSSMEKAPKFEVTDDLSEGHDKPEKEEVTTKRGFLAKLHIAIYRRIYLEFIKPVQYKPVVFGVKTTEKKRLSVAFLCAGWIVASITITITSFFVVLYGLKFGPKKSLVWALTFLTGTFSNGIIFAPLRMAIIGLIVALTFKKSYLDMYTMQIQIDYSKLTHRNYMNRLKINFHKRLKGDYKPCKTVVLEKHRSQKFRGREFKYLMTHSVMVISMFAVVILLATLLGVREGYYHIRQLTELFTDGKLDESAHRVWNNISMFKFFSKTPIPALHRLKWYNNRTLKVERNERRADRNSPRYQSQVKGFVKDYTNKLVGIPRLRQLRIVDSSYNKRKIPNMIKRYRSNALGHYYWFDVDRSNYLPSWVPYNGYHGWLEQTWAYYSQEQTKTGTTNGYSWIQYRGGGHVIPLSWNLGYSLRRIKYLELSGWVTNRTRCVFLEINVYNNNMKHFSVMRFIIEALPAGIYWNRPQMDVATMHLAGRPKAQAVLLLVTILLALLMCYSVLCVWHSSRDGLLAYLSTWRGFSDLLLISAGLLTVSSQYNRALHFSLITDYLDKEPRDKYTSLFSPLKTKSQASDIFCILCLILMFNMSCTLFKFKIYNGMYRVLAKVYKVGISAFLILNLYAILIGIHSITHDTELGKLFILQFTFREELFHEFHQESKVLYVLFTPIIYALFKFHIGYLVSSHDVFSQEWTLPTFFTSSRFRPKKPKPLPRRSSVKPRRARTRRPPRSQTSRKARKQDDLLQLIK